ncbi:unnamed protein product [Ectocarpus sp. CCAP 1310/34]|nr:unnamed protein product [Ectocarpus sp. CCAP 1310/34]
MVDVAVVVLRVLAEVRDVAEDVMENDRQACRLLKRALAIEAPVLAVQNGTSLTSADSLRQLLTTVEKIRNFLEEYARMTKFNRALNRRSNAAEFMRLGLNLTEGMQALHLEVAVDVWAKEDASDRQEDIENMLDMMETVKRNQTDKHAEVMNVLKALRKDERSELAGWIEIDYEKDLDFDGSALLGWGGFGEVRTAKWKGADVAVKHLMASGIHRDTVRDLRKEIRLHSSLSFDFVTPLYAASTIIPHLCLVVELASGGSLQQYLRSASDPLGHALQAAFLYDVARGMTFLHDKGILHRDLKSANVLMFTNGRLKICDFGLSKVKTYLSSRPTRGAVGTTQWMSPEEMNESPANELTDVYSFGVLCFEVVTRTEPFKGRIPAHVIRAVLYENERPQIPEGASAAPEVVPLMEQCWRQDPVERPEGFGPVVRALASVVSRDGDPRNHNAATADLTSSPGVGVDLQAPAMPSAGGDIAGPEPELPSVDASSCCCWGFTLVAVALAINAIAGADHSTLVMFIPQFIMAGTLLCCAICFICCMRDAEAPLVDASLTYPEVPSVDVKKPQKSKFGQKNPQFMKEGKTSTPEIPGVDASIDVPSISGNTSVEVPGVSVDTPSIDPSVDTPFVTADASLPSASVDVPPAEEDASMPSVGDLSADVGAKAGEVSADVGAKVGDVKADLGAKVDDISAKAPGVKSVEVRKPKKDVLGGLSLKKPSGKISIGVPDMPEMPSLEGGAGGELSPSGVSVTAPDVQVEGGDTSLTAGLAASGVAIVGAIGAAVGLSGDKPDAEVPSGVVHVSLSIPEASVDIRKPRKVLFGGLPFKKPPLMGRTKGKHEKVQPLFERSLAIHEKSLGPDHPLVAAALHNRGKLLMRQGKYEEAGPLLERSLAIYETSLGTDSPHVATALDDRAKLLKLGKHEKVQPLFERSLAIHEKSLGPDHPLVAAALHNRGKLLMRQGKYEEAGPLFERSLTIYEKSLGPDHPNVAAALNEGKLLMSQGKYDEAEPLYRRSLAIDEEVHGRSHPEVATDLSNWAGLFEKQGKYAEADPLYLRAIEIGEKTLGPDHAALATRLNNRALLLGKQGKYEEAGLLLERSLTIYEKSLGPDHPEVATALRSRANLLMIQVRGKRSF